MDVDIDGWVWDSVDLDTRRSVEDCALVLTDDIVEVIVDVVLSSPE